MAEKPTWEQIERDRDEPVALPLDPETALRGLLTVEPTDKEALPPNGSATRSKSSP
jgi:hypothetical protein